MSNFESQHVRWQDGKMSPSEKKRFEARLGTEARVEREDWEDFRKMMKENMSVPPLEYPDFLNSRIKEAIARGDKPPVRRPDFVLPGLRWLALSATALLIISGTLTVLFLPGGFRMAANGDYHSLIVEAQVSDPWMAAYVITTPTTRGTILWTEGAGYIPAEEKIK